MVAAKSLLCNTVCIIPLDERSLASDYQGTAQVWPLYIVLGPHRHQPTGSAQSVLIILLTAFVFFVGYGHAERLAAANTGDNDSVLATYSHGKGCLKAEKNAWKDVPHPLKSDTTQDTWIACLLGRPSSSSRRS